MVKGTRPAIVAWWQKLVGIGTTIFFHVWKGKTMQDLASWLPNHLAFSKPDICHSKKTYAIFVHFCHYFMFSGSSKTGVSLVPIQLNASSISLFNSIILSIYHWSPHFPSQDATIWTAAPGMNLGVQCEMVDLVVIPLTPGLLEGHLDWRKWNCLSSFTIQITLPLWPSNFKCIG